MSPRPGLADRSPGRLPGMGPVPGRRPDLDPPVLLGTPVHYDAHAPVRLSGPAADDLDEHLHRFGPRPASAGADGDRLLRVLERIGLTGRGGAHFAAVRKWRTVLEAGGGGVVVANGAEGEPGSAKDAALLQNRTHLILDGLACATEAVAATRAVVWLHAGAHTTHRAVLRALAQRRAAGLPDRLPDLQAQAVLLGGCGGT